MSRAVHASAYPPLQAYPKGVYERRVKIENYGSFAAYGRDRAEADTVEVQRHNPN